MLQCILLWSAHHALRISHFTENSAVISNCIGTLLCTLCYTVLLLAQDVATLTAYAGSWGLLNAFEQYVYKMDRSDGWAGVYA